MSEESTENTPSNEEGSSSGSSRTIIILLIAIVALVIIGLGSLALLYLRDDEPEATPTTQATVATAEAPGPEVEVDPVWANIQATGTMRVGTSADYPPFEYYTDDYQLDGFDMALIRTIGQKLGLTVDISDMAFDGLGDALRVNQIDVAIAAITVTDEREQFVDFSNIYFVTEDAQLAARDSQITINSADDLASYKLGVESGTIYENFVRTELIETGKMPESALHVYPDIQHALAELAVEHIDVVLLDKAVAVVTAEEHGFTVVGGGHNRLRLAVSIPQDAFTLQAELNAALAELQAEGIVAQLIEEYFGIDAGLLPPIPTPVPGQPTPTPAPPSGCINAMEYVADLSYDDQNFTNIPQLPPGTPFQKGWKVRNTGTCTWDNGYSLVPVNGNNPAARMGGVPTPVQGIVSPGQTYDIWVNLTSPLNAGTYVEYWTMRSPQANLFGARMWVAITVLAGATPTPVATQTPSAEIAFTADPEVINQGQCSTLKWTSQNVKAVYVYPQGENWQDYGVPGTGEQVVCPQVTTTYEMRVVKNDDSVEIRNVTVYVIPNAQAPQIDRFTVEPPGTITLGQCVLITWSVSGNVSTVNIWRNDVVIRPNAPSSGQMQDCPADTGQFVYKLEATGSGGNSVASQTIQVVPAATATPTLPPEEPTNTPVPPATATATPQSDPVIYTFLATPSEVPVGECVTLVWSVGGNTDLVQILKNGTVVWDDAPFRDSGQDCELNAPGTVSYGIVASNDEGEAAEQGTSVNVVAGVAAQ